MKSANGPEHLAQKEMSMNDEDWELKIRPHLDEMGRSLADVVENYIKIEHPELINED